MKHFLLVSALMLASTTMIAQKINYPKAPTSNTIDEYFGEKVSDPYRPLENDRSEETKSWVDAENIVTNNYLKKIPFRNKLLKRLTELSNYERYGIPFKKYGKWYVYFNNGLQNQSVLYQMEKLGGKKHTLLDPNTLSSDGTVALQDISFSHNGKYLAYVISRSGSDWREIYIKDLSTGKNLTDQIKWVKFSGAVWCGNGFYYSAYDKPTKGKEFSSKNEVHKVYYHKIGTPQSQDELFYQNPSRPLSFYDVSINKEETIMFLFESGAGSGNNLYVRDLRKPNSQLIQLTDNMDLQYFPVEVKDDKVYILTNYNAPKKRLMVMDINNPSLKNWKEIIPESNNVLENVTFTNGKLIAQYNKDASTHAYLYDLNGNIIREITLPGLGSASFSGERNQKETFYSFSSFTTPGTIYLYDTDTNQSKVFIAPKVKFKSNDFITEQKFFKSKDGTKIPMFLTYKKGLKRNSKNPVFLYGYGGFNIALGPSFSPMRIPFLESGGIYAQASLRGGSEYGEQWHIAGTKMNKQNVFDDFISAAEWLIENKYTSSKYMAIVGGSNGGLLVGACMTQRPDLFQVCVPQVGVMDMLRYHKFTIGWNWASDYGTSEDSKEMFEYLKSYSPLHNIKPNTKYPATLITTADHDDRVVPAHSFKFAATLQNCQLGSSPILIRIDTKAGHGGGKPLSKRLEESADIYSFILYNMGLKY